MSIQDRRENEKAEMKQNIMRAAIELIEQEGYEKLSIRKIASRIEYSPTTIYLYYKDKAQIIEDMTNELYCNVMEEITMVLEKGEGNSVDQQIQDSLKVFIKSLCGEPEMAKAIMYSGVNVIFANGNEGGELENSGIAILDRQLEDGIEQKLFRSGCANSAWMIVSSVLGFVLCVIENKLYLHDDFDQDIVRFVDILMGGVRIV